MAVNNFNPAYNFVRGYTCAADIAANVIVKISTNEVVALATAATDAVMGVTVTANGGAGRFLDVAYGGQAQVLCGGSFTAGAPLVADGAGLAVGITPVATAGTVVNKIIGYALTDGASGQLAILRLEPGAVVIS
jgi:hypothetical protein